MACRDVVVIGASAGGVGALMNLVGTLPPDLPAAVFAVLHIPPHSPSHLPEILSRSGPLPAVHPADGETIKRGRIYVAPPDRHLLLEKNRILVKNGPKENRTRPAVDALFRSAAYVFGPRVIGVVLTGTLDDGVSGLWTIKRRGGTTIVQTPKDAEFPDMPANALSQVDVDHIVPVAAMGALLGELVRKPAPKGPKISAKEQKRLQMEITIAMQDGAFEMGIMEMGEFTPFTCPECHGALIRLKEGAGDRFRCHTGHAFTMSALLAGLTQVNEEKLWEAMRGFEEAVMLLEQLGNQFKKERQSRSSNIFFAKAKEMKARAQIIHDSVLKSENLSVDIRRQGNGDVS